MKMSIHASKYLSAVEITIAEDRDQWREGRVRGYPRRLACTQGSDAHAIEEIGRRPIYAAMDTVSLDGLRAALQSFESAIRFPGEQCREVRPAQ